MSVDEPQVQCWVACPRAAQRLLGHVHPHRLRPRTRQLGREGALAAADVEHALAGVDVFQQKAAAQREVGRLQPLRHALPEALVIGARGHLHRQG